MRKGDIEIEYQGTPSEVSSKFSEAFDWLKGATVVTEPSRPSVESGDVSVRPPEGGKQGRKGVGGARTPVISPAIDKLIEEGFLDDFKPVPEITKELRRRTVPVSGDNRVSTALNRKIPKTLERIEDDQGRWVYRRRKQ